MLRLDRFEESIASREIATQLTEQLGKIVLHEIVIATRPPVSEGRTSRGCQRPGTPKR